jgi:hypothetical protein
VVLVVAGNDCHQRSGVDEHRFHADPNAVR